MTSEQSAKRASMARKSGENHRVNPVTTNKDYSGCLAEFLREIDAYKSRLGRRFMSNSEIFEMIQGLGYTKTGVMAG